MSSPAPQILFERLARKTRCLLRDAKRWAMSFSETSITDLNLLAMVKASLPGVRVFRFSGAFEARIGCDWEWWIGQAANGPWLRYAVQAKVQHRLDRKYRALRHLVGIEWQIDLLERYARRAGAIPLYCFYNHARG
jgi:hypothetical protein